MAVTPGEKLMTEVRALREVAVGIDQLHVSNAPEDVAEYVRDQADRKEAEAKGGV